MQLVLFLAHEKLLPSIFSFYTASSDEYPSGSGIATGQIII